jgi:tetratricopeptide (TPR) repeat protein
LPETTITTTVVSSDTEHHKRRHFQNFLVIWLDAAIDQTNEDCQNTLVQLRIIVGYVHMFTQRDECVDFLTGIADNRAFLVVEGVLGKEILPLIHDIPQLHSIYILCRNKTKYEEWAKTWVKIKGIHTEITPLCESVQHVVKQSNRDSIAVSFLAADEGTSSVNLNQLEPSFMYTQIFKEILMAMDYDEQSIKKFTIYCRNGDCGSPSIINQFENEYQAKSAVWWYTYPSFIYSLLNNALRLMEADTIIHMGFFIRDLHRQIEQLHQKYVSNYHCEPFLVYRGQGLSTTDFEKLRNTKAGLISFNNFLSTSKKREVSLGFAMIALTITDMVGILFQISIDPSVSSTPLAAIQEVSYFNEEEEILFSMNTIFRIGEIKRIDNNNPLYQVELRLTSDDDPQLRRLTEQIRKETPGSTGWKRLGQLLIKIGQLNKAEELYNALLEQTFDENEKALYYNQLGSVKYLQADYDKAIWYNKKALEIYHKNSSANQLNLAASYSNIGEVYQNMGEHSKALSFFEKALEIKQKIFPPDHPSLATSYNNIGLMYHNMGEYSKALSFYEKALHILQKTLPPNHPSFAATYGNIGRVYQNMGEYPKAVSFHEKALEIDQKALPLNHPSLATSYSNMAEMYKNNGYYSKALSFHEKSLEIYQKTLPVNHPLLSISYNNISGVYKDMGEYSKALSFCEKSLEILQKSFLPNHSLLSASYNNIAFLYENMREHSKALSFYQKVLEIYQKTLPPNDPSLATLYSNVGLMSYNIGEYSKAISFYEKELHILHKTLPPNHPSLAISYNNLGTVYDNMREYSKALPFYEKALEIYQKTLLPNHSSLAAFYNNIGGAYMEVGQYSKALSCMERAFDIFQRSLPSNHHNIQNTRRGIEMVKKKLQTEI